MCFKKIQKIISNYNFDLFIFSHVVAYSLCLYCFPHAETFIVITLWTMFIIFYAIIFSFKVPILILTVVPFSAYKLYTLNFSDFKNFIPLDFLILKVLATIILITLGVVFFIKFKKTEEYVLIKKVSQDVNESDKVWDTHMTVDVFFFGALREGLLYLFIVINIFCFFNDTLFIHLLSSKNATVIKLTYSFIMLFGTMFFLVFVWRFGFCFFFNTFTKSPIFCIAKRACKYALAATGNLYIFDRICISGDFELPTNWYVCRSYQESQLGCVVRTKSQLLKVNTYRGLGFKGALPYTVVDNVKELDIDALEGRIELKKNSNTL